MARTVEARYVKVSHKKPGPSSSKSVKAGKKSAGNPACPRPTPSWQKPITEFLQKNEDSPREAPISSKPDDVMPE